MEHCSLLGDIARFAERVAEGPVQIQEARRMSGNGDFLHESQTNRRNAPGFDFSGEQSHGPRADGSGGHQKSQINTRLADAPRNLFDRRHEPLGTAHQTETVVLLGQTPDDVFGLKLAKALDRKHQVEVPKRIGSVVGLV
jgi:hypothetical protein